MKINSIILVAKKTFCPKILLLILLHVGAIVLGTAGVWAYSYSGYRWSGTSVSYYISSGIASTLRTAIRTSDATWDAAGSAFRFNYASTTTRSATSSSGPNDGYSDVLYYNSGSTGRMATTTTRGSGSTITQEDTVFNSYYSFTTSGASGAYDMQNTMTHEFGHWLNLGDLSSVISPSWCYWSFESTMCGATSTGETRKRSLAGDDQNGIIAIYGR